MRDKSNYNADRNRAKRTFPDGAFQPHSIPPETIISEQCSEAAHTCALTSPGAGPRMTIAAHVPLLE